MSKDTNIEWADSTLNPQMGCDGCELWNPKAGIFKCYAGQLTNRYGGHSAGYPASFDQPQLFLHRLLEAEKWKDLTGKDREGKPWLNGLPRCIFLNDMGDTFTESLPEDWLASPDGVLDGRTPLEILAGMKAIIMLLTKRPSRMRRFFETRKVPDNFMLMTSVTSDLTMGRVKELISIDCRWRGISYEPAWGLAEFDSILKVCKCWKNADSLPHAPWNPPYPKFWYEPQALVLASWKQPLDLIIFGGESGQNPTPTNLDWARQTRDATAAAKVPFFMKQVDKVQPIPTDLNICQMPAFTLEPAAMEVSA